MILVNKNDLNHIGSFSDYIIKLPTQKSTIEKEPNGINCNLQVMRC